MNKLNFLQTGGFPLETDTLHAMQVAYELFNGLGALAGNKSIIKGCVTTGGSTSDGIVYIDGEVYEFRGGTSQSTVRIIQEATSKEFENGDVNEVHYTRYVTFASGSGSIPWSEFTRANPILELQKALVPVGMISMWSGAIGNIPIGWKLCDGANGTPNLKGKFIVGYDPADEDYNTIGATGGEKQHELTNEEMPEHNHGGVTSVAGAHTHTYDWEDTVGLGSPGAEDGSSSFSTRNTSSAGNHTHTIFNDGGGEAHENRPPYYTLAYIMYTGN